MYNQLDGKLEALKLHKSAPNSAEKQETFSKYSLFSPSNILDNQGHEVVLTPQLVSQICKTVST